MTILTHRDIPRIAKQLNREPYLTCGAPPCPSPDYLHARVTLRVPAGELAHESVALIVGMGRYAYETTALTGREGFSAQGLEGAVTIVMPFLSAYFLLRDFIAPHRGRIEIPATVSDTFPRTILATKGA